MRRTFVLGLRLSAFFCAAVVAPARASLAWEKMRVDVAPKSTEPFATGEFDFQNTGTSPITITEVRPDCSCVTAPLEKKTYAPGEHGQITAIFSLDRQSGEHTVPIQVRTDAPGVDAAKVLIFHVSIIDVVSFSERFLYWRPGEPLTPKTVTVTLLAGERLEIKTVHAANPAFTAELTPAGDNQPGKFLLRVTPPVVRVRGICPITVLTVSPGQNKPIAHTMTARIL